MVQTDPPQALDELWEKSAPGEWSRNENRVEVGRCGLIAECYSGLSGLARSHAELICALHNSYPELRELLKAIDFIINPEHWYTFDHVDGRPDHTFSICGYCGGEGDNEKEDHTLVEHGDGCPIGELLEPRTAYEAKLEELTQ